MSGKNKETRQDFPVRKISETLIDFAQPFVSIIDQNTMEEQIRSGFMIAVTVWNAVVFDAVSGNHKYYDMLRRTLGKEFDNDPLVPNLISRKQKHFGNDMRAIGDYTVTYKNGKLHVRAEARDPYTCNCRKD